MKDGPRPLTAERALAAHVPQGSPDSCWEWTGARSEKGYGVVTLSRRQWRAHRVAYAAAHGPIPPGALVRHRCDNPPCCNPAHLLAGSHDDNQRDAVERDRTSFGERQWMAVLTETDVLDIRSRRLAGETCTALAKEYGVTTATISSVAKGRTWRRAGRVAA